ncbi:vesicle fusion and protein sorting subunit [Cystoisospora suis]|uniref:Vesicle fusion and protein sorting subunit n=1 Tax=Cystoisospora suis TaxID=483139 RepID=A0A2C6KM20_9APIC|nr:vesicle fusion and protein sorting subunit [Cystoisospora suis]
MLQSYYEKSGRVFDAGVVALSIANRQKTWDMKKKSLETAAKFFNGCRSTHHDSAAFAHNSVLSQIELLTRQHELEVQANSRGWANPPHHFMGLSLMETVRQVILKMEFQEADNLQKVFKIPDKRYWRCKIDALADGQYFDELLAFAQYRTSPVGYEPFVIACLRNDQVNLAAKIIPKIKEAEQQAHWYRELEMHEEAEAALKNANSQSLGIFQTLTDALKGRR